MSKRIRFSCTGCGRAIAVDAEKSGRKLRCPDCQAVISVPLESSENPAPRKLSDEHSATADAPNQEKRRPPRSTRKTQKSAYDDPNDIWSQPLSSYSSPAIQEEEYEQYGIAPKRQKVQQETNNNEMTLKGPMVFFGVGAIVGIVAIALAFAVPAAGRITGFVAIGLGSLLSLIGHWKIRETAFEESTTCGFLYVWMPFYQPYYILSRFAYIKTPFLVSILGNVILFLGVLGWVFADMQLEKAAGT